MVGWNSKATDRPTTRPWTFNRTGKKVVSPLNAKSNLSIEENSEKNDEKK